MLKRTLTITLIVASLVTAFGFTPHVTYAAQTSQQLGPPAPATNSNDNTPGTGGATQCGPGFWDNLTPTCIAESIAGFIGTVMLRISSWILWGSGVFLNASVTWTILKFAEITKAMSSINDAWTTMRDLSNMFFIFTLLYIAIRMILNLGGSTQSLIRNLILAALFINFSLFIVNVVIDASNIVATNFYCSIVVCDGNASGVNYADKGLSNEVVSQLKLPSVYSGGGDFHDPSAQFQHQAPGNTSPITNPVTLLIVGIMGSIVMVVAAVIFFTAAGMLFKRFIVLIFLMIFSPLAFLGLILPKIPTSTFWQRLWSETMYAPAFFIITWVAFKILRGAHILNIMAGGNGNASTDWASSISSGLSATMIPLIINFVIVIGFLIFALVAAQKLGGSTPKVWNTIGGFVGRHTFGRAGKFVDDKLGNTAFGNTAVMRSLRESTTGALASSKFGGARSFKTAVKEQETAEKKFAEKRMEKLEDKNQKNIQTRETGIRQLQSDKANRSAKLATNQKSLGAELQNVEKLDAIIATSPEGAPTREALEAEALRKTAMDRVTKLRNEAIQINKDETFNDQQIKDAEKDLKKMKSEGVKILQGAELENLEQTRKPKFLQSGARKKLVKELRKEFTKYGGGGGGKGGNKTPEQQAQDLLNQSGGDKDDAKKLIDDL